MAKCRRARRLLLTNKILRTDADEPFSQGQNTSLNHVPVDFQRLDYFIFQ